MITIGAVWLFAVISCADPRELPCREEVIQRAYPSAGACERERARILRRFPRSYVTCDR